MSQDTYSYQVKPLPRLPPFGEEGFAAVQLGALQLQSPDLLGPGSSPFSNPDYPDSPGTGGGGGGGGGTTPTCATDWSIGTIGTSAINLPCESPTSTIGAGAVALSSGGGTAELSAVNGWIKVSNGTGQLDIDMADVDADSGVIQLNDLDVCHLGAPGLRQFVCGDAREP